MRTEDNGPMDIERAAGGTRPAIHGRGVDAEGRGGRVGHGGDGTEGV